MKTLVNRIAMIAASAMFLGTTAFGQTEMKARIPFAFQTGLSALPGGSYGVSQINTHGGALLVTLTNRESRKAVIVPPGVMDTWKTGSPSMLFQCSGDEGCVLTGIRTPTGTVVYAARHRHARSHSVATIAIPLRAVNAD